MTRLCNLLVKFKVNRVAFNAEKGQKFSFDELPDNVAEAVAEAWNWTEPHEVDVEVISVSEEEDE